MEKRNLDEVSFVRPILIVLLVLFHSFVIYDGLWRAPEGMVMVPAYSWVAKSSYAIMLEMFVFISGYLWAFQRESLGKTKSFWQTVVNKFNRLIVPCLVFSALYLVFFNQSNQLDISVLDVMGGVGHLWFLPMLFWCFVLGYAIIHIRIKPIVKLIILCALVSLSILPLPFRIGATFQYLVFFIGGYLCMGCKDELIHRLQDKRWLLWVGFIFAFVGVTLLEEKLSFKLLVERTDMVSKVVYLESKAYLRLLFASIGVVALYLSAVHFTTKHLLKKWYIEIGKYCMGVYVFQQFILQYLMYYTSLPAIVGFIALPWVAFAIALMSSLLIAYTIKSL